MNGRGYWINAATGVVVDVTWSTHIQAIANAPESFGTTRDEVDRTYARHGEPLYVERNAREEIIVRTVLATDWVRVRESVRPSGWTLNYRDESQRDRVRGLLLRQAPGLTEEDLRWRRLEDPHSCGQVVQGETQSNAVDNRPAIPAKGEAC
jgi:hypothetical protein